MQNILPQEECAYIINRLAALGFKKLEQYYASPLWQARKKAYFVRHPYRCRNCNAPGWKRVLQLHHKTYRNLGNEPDEDLELQCVKCHHRFHRKLTKKLVRKRRAAFYNKGKMRRARSF